MKAEARERHRYQRTAIDQEAKAAKRLLRIRKKAEKDPNRIAMIRQNLKEKETRRSKRLNESWNQCRTEMKALHAKRPLMNWSVYLN